MCFIYLNSKCEVNNKIKNQLNCHVIFGECNCLFTIPLSIKNNLIVEFGVYSWFNRMTAFSFDSVSIVQRCSILFRKRSEWAFSGDLNLAFIHFLFQEQTYLRLEEVRQFSNKYLFKCQL